MLVRIIKIASLMLVFMGIAGVSTYLTVHLLIRSRDTVVVPDLVTKEVVYALEVLTDLGLNTKVKGMTFNPKVPKNHIIAQEPAPGHEIKKGRDVRLVISRGPRDVVLPNLTGIDLPQANIIIDQNGLKKGLLSHVFHNKIPKDEIVTQYPLAGELGLRGDNIDLLISAGKGPMPIQMINLKGMGLSQAIALIEQNHLRVGPITIETHPKRAENTVMAHTPSAGYPAAAGSTVGLTINRPVKDTNPAKLRETLFRYRTPQGFLRQHVRVKIIQQIATYELYNAFVKPGEDIWLIIPANMATSLFLYVDGELIKTEYYN